MNVTKDLTASAMQEDLILHFSGRVQMSTGIAWSDNITIS